MAKEKSEKTKDDKKSKRTSTGAVEKPEKADKAAKKDKKEKKEKRASKAAELVDVDASEVNADVSMVDETVVKDEDEGDDKPAVNGEIPLAALVPFANPLCDEKSSKKVLKTVKKAAKQKCLKRGVKEVVKAVRKTPSGVPSASGLPNGIVVLAADISPMDVISHIPVLCEDHNIPYVFLTSRAELGAAGATKRPTSVVMLTPQGPKGQTDDEWTEAFGDLNKLAVKQGQRVKF